MHVVKHVCKMRDNDNIMRVVQLLVNGDNELIKSDFTI